MNEQNTGESAPQGLAFLNHLIERTTVRLVHWIDHLHDLVVHGDCTIEAMRVIVIVEGALSRLIEERYLLSSSEPAL